VLREAGLVTGEIDGPATCYCLNPEAILWLKDQIAAWLPECCPPGAQVPACGRDDSICCSPSNSCEGGIK